MIEKPNRMGPFTKERRNKAKMVDVYPCGNSLPSTFSGQGVRAYCDGFGHYRNSVVVEDTAFRNGGLHGHGVGGFGGTLKVEYDAPAKPETIYFGEKVDKKWQSKKADGPYCHKCKKHCRSCEHYPGKAAKSVLTEGDLRAIGKACSTSCKKGKKGKKKTKRCKRRRCGAKNKRSNRFCTDCGHRL